MTYPYLCGTCRLFAPMTMPALTAHWRAHLGNPTTEEDR